jgi:hypothetical protein
MPVLLPRVHVVSGICGGDCFRSLARPYGGARGPFKAWLGGAPSAAVVTCLRPARPIPPLGWLDPRPRGRIRPLVASACGSGDPGWQLWLAVVASSVAALATTTSTAVPPVARVAWVVSSGG